MSAHLGDRVSALVDGQLAPAVAERALAHVAGCARCAADLAAARAARRVLCDVDDVRPAGDLTARLLALGGCGPADGPSVPADRRPRTGRPMDPFVPPSGAHAAFTSASQSGIAGLLGSGTVLGGGSVLGSRGLLGGRGVLGGRPVVAATAPAAPGHGRRGLRAAVGSITGLGVVAVGLFLLGDRPAVAPEPESTEALALLGDANATAVPVLATGSGPGSGLTPEPADGASTQEYLDWMRAQGWTCPTQVPAGWSVTSVRLRDEGSTLQVDLAGPSGEVVVTEQQGRLDLSALPAAEPIEVEGHTVYLLSNAPWHAAWQSGDTVVEVVSDRTGPDAAAVVAQFPGGDFDAGLPARLNRGWDTFAAAVHLP
ncbi:zf-HC2 domain-containing protein [Cellulomonas sp. Marseille-Q8402]